MTPPLLRELISHGLGGRLDAGALRLRPGVAPTELVKAAARDDVSVGVVFDSRELEAGVERALRPDATTLWLLYALASEGGSDFKPSSSRCSTVCYSRRMAREITQRELRNESGEIMRQLDKGESFVVTRNGVPVGELTPLRRHRFVSADAAIAMFRNAPGVDFEQFRADLDIIATQDPRPRG